MALVTISKAAELAGMSRTQLYRGYINKGKVSVNKDDPKNPKVDTSELLRVFPKLEPGNETSSQPMVLRVAADNELLRERIYHLEQLLNSERQIVTAERQRADQLYQTILMLEHRAQQTASDPIPDQAPAPTMATGPGTIQATGVPTPEVTTTAQPIRRGLFSWIFGR